MDIISELNGVHRITRIMGIQIWRSDSIEGNFHNQYCPVTFENAYAGTVGGSWCNKIGPLHDSVVHPHTSARVKMEFLHQYVRQSLMIPITICDEIIIKIRLTSVNVLHLIVRIIEHLGNLLSGQSRMVIVTYQVVVEGCLMDHILTRW